MDTVCTCMRAHVCMRICLCACLHVRAPIVHAQAHGICDCFLGGGEGQKANALDGGQAPPSRQGRLLRMCTCTQHTDDHTARKQTQQPTTHVHFGTRSGACPVTPAFTTLAMCAPCSPCF